MQNGKQCIHCCTGKHENKRLARSSFYKSYNPKYRDGLLPMCKKCCKEESLDDAGKDVDLSRFQIMLHSNDLPFIANLYKAAVSQAERKYSDASGNAKGESIVGLYLSKLSSLQQYRKMTWADSVFDDDSDSAAKNQKRNEKNTIHISDIDGDKLRSITMFNAGLEFELIKVMLNLLKPHYSSSDLEVLIFYIQNRIGQELSIAENDIGLYQEFKHDADEFLIQLKESQGTDQDADFSADYADMYLREERRE